jgi:hypothetical protein
VVIGARGRGRRRDGAALLLAVVVMLSLLSSSVVMMRCRVDGWRWWRDGAPGARWCHLCWAKVLTLARWRGPLPCCLIAQSL